MSDRWWRDDEQLLAELGDAVRSARDVPDRFVDVGKAAFAWRNVDAELAELVGDSALDDDSALDGWGGSGGAGPGDSVTAAGDAVAAGTRAEAAPLRTLTFVARELTIEVEVTDDALLGQVTPPGRGEVELSVRDGSVRAVPSDEVGWFVIRPAPVGLCRLHVRAADGASVLTQWFTL